MIAGLGYSRKITPYKRTPKMNHICAIVKRMSFW